MKELLIFLGIFAIYMLFLIRKQKQPRQFTYTPRYDNDDDEDGGIEQDIDDLPKISPTNGGDFFFIKDDEEKEELVH